ncbi:MAG: undecaprenyldiphospho-muramoylpentapeptide beta-N-acetylglucosaminyltransferase [Oscillospiraceae bacterium]|nr:undecaprenyldiphospho-muramoylpentapeptide beta-N-acetylglucosaminyltransferase [Oscillospiraceae bacterium]
MRVLLAGGGTGGHINPALAIANEIKKNEPDSEILFAGTPKGMEAKLVPQAGYNFTTIKVAGFQRKLTPYNIYRNIKALWYLVFSGARAARIIKSFKPDIVIGTGGYVSGPIVKKAQNLGIKTAIHEQNAFPGVTTKLLAPAADAVMLAFPKAKEFLPESCKFHITGNPIRESILLARKDKSRKALGLDDRFCLLSFGGSLGAETINRVASEVIALNIGEFNHIHATGKYGTELVPELLKKKGIENLPSGTIVREYIDNMDECLAAADLVVCRAGAITLSELAAAGKPAVLIPSPNVAENHQFKNAKAVEENGAALVYEDKNIDYEAVAKDIVSLINDKNKVKTLEKNASANAIVDANERIYKIIKGLF